MRQGFDAPERGLPERSRLGYHSTGGLNTVVRLVVLVACRSAAAAFNLW